MKIFSPIQVIDLRFQVVHIAPKTIHFFEEYRADPRNARLFAILFKYKQLKMISNGHKITQVKVI